MLILMVIFSPLAIDIFLPALPIMANDLSAPLVDMQLSITVFMLSMGLGQLFTGPLTDRFGRKPIAIYGILIYLVSAFLCVYADSLTMHLLARLVQGFGTCAIVVAAFAIVRDKFDAIESGAMYSYLNGIICCVPALAPILGGWLTTLYGWHSTFQFMGLYAVFALVLILSFLKETHPGDATVKVTRLPVAIYISILKQPQFLFHATLVMLSMAVIIAYVSCAPSWLMVELGLSSDEFIYWFSLNASINIAACLIAPKILKTYGAQLTISVGFFVLILGGVLMLALKSHATAFNFMLPIMFSSVGFSLLMGTSAGQALEPFAKRAGTASALLGFMQMSGSAVLVTIVQSLAINEVEQVALLMLSVIPLLALWFSKRVKLKVLAS